MARSYVATALAAGPNRSAAAVTLVIALSVLALGRLPLAPGSELDLRRPEHVDGWAQASLFDFGEPDDRGRSLGNATARIVWNRPLPAHFTLSLDAVAVADGRPARIRVAIGDQQQWVPLSRRGPTNIELDNPHGLRELALSAAPASARVRLRRAAVR